MTDKSETKQGSTGVENDPQICVAEKSVGETDKQEKVPDVEKVSYEVTDKSETKQVSAGVEDNPQICVMEKSVEEKDQVGDQVTDKMRKRRK